MSFSEKDRKLQSKTGNSFPSPQPHEPLAAAIAAALKAEFGNTPSAHKTVAQLTRSNERAVRNWFEGKNSPSGENLVILMRHSDFVLRTMLSLADLAEVEAWLTERLATARRSPIDRAPHPDVRKRKARPVKAPDQARA